ncbi:MAG: hypothetical protein JWP25_1159 [Bradyrhizobium sp.]|nr:hypothetical protein [Bradyrhizobium sp.]
MPEAGQARRWTLAILFRPLRFAVGAPVRLRSEGRAPISQEASPLCSRPRRQIHPLLHFGWRPQDRRPNCEELFSQQWMEWRRTRTGSGAMHLHTYRDESRSRHFDLISGGEHPRSIDLVVAMTSDILVISFACALVSLRRTDQTRRPPPSITRVWPVTKVCRIR